MLSSGMLQQSTCLSLQAQCCDQGEARRGWPQALVIWDSAVQIFSYCGHPLLVRSSQHWPLTGKYLHVGTLCQEKSSKLLLHMQYAVI